MLLGHLLHTALQWVKDMAEAGADQYTFHLEATSGCMCSALNCVNHAFLGDPEALIKQIRAANMKVNATLLALVWLSCCCCRCERLA